MTPRQIELVQSSYAALAPRRDSAGGLFYDRLLEAAPEIRPMFRTDIRAQGRKFIDMLSVAVDGLTHIERLLPAISQFASRHRQYGARPEHFALVGVTLVETLAQVSGEDFTLEIAEAWTAAYTALSEAMIDAAYPDLVIAKLTAAE